MSKELETQIRDAEERLRRAMLASDVAALDEILAPDLVFTNHLGQRLGKEADLSAHQSGALTISRLESSEQQVQLLGDSVAIVSVRVQLAGQYAGQPAEGEFRFTRVWSNLCDHWQVVAAHSVVIA